jgi:hypothetical protein
MFQLALALGRTVAELEETMSSRELTEWIAYNAIQPFGDTRADLRSAIIASTVANCHRTSGTPFKVADFMPYEDKPRGAPLDAVKQLRAMFGGKRNG